MGHSVYMHHHFLFSKTPRSVRSVAAKVGYRCTNSSKHQQMVSVNMVYRKKCVICTVISSLLAYKHDDKYH